MKTCTNCKTEKELTEFRTRKLPSGNASVFSWCRLCVRNDNKAREKVKHYKAKTRKTEEGRSKWNEYQRNYHREKSRLAKLAKDAGLA